MDLRTFLDLIKKKRKYYGIKYFDFLEMTGLSESKYKRRTADPGKFTLEEVYIIMDVLKFTKEERIAIFCENS